MSLNLVSLNQEEKKHAYHTLSHWEQEVITDFLKGHLSYAQHGVPLYLTATEAHKQAAQLRQLLTAPDADQRLVEQSKDRARQPHKGQEPPLSPAELTDKARAVITGYAEYLENCQGHYNGRGPGR